MTLRKPIDNWSWASLNLGEDQTLLPELEELENWFKQFLAQGGSITYSVLLAKLDLAEIIGGIELRNQLHAQYCEKEQKERPYYPMN